MSRLIIGGYVNIWGSIFIPAFKTHGEGIVETQLVGTRYITKGVWCNEVDVAWQNITYVDNGTRSLCKTRELAEEYDRLYHIVTDSKYKRGMSNLKAFLLENYTEINDEEVEL